MSLRPLAPWQAAQSVAKRCAYSAGPAFAADAAPVAFAALAARAGFAAGCGNACAWACEAVATSRVAATAARARRPFGGRLEPSLAAVADAIDRSGMVV